MPMRPKAEKKEHFTTETQRAQREEGKKARAARADARRRYAAARIRFRAASKRSSRISQGLTLLRVSLSVFWPTALAAHRLSEGFALSSRRWRKASGSNLFPCPRHSVVKIAVLTKP
jgi:hypothetical protein